MESISVGVGTQITLHFSLSLEDGRVIDSNMEGDPATFVYGDGNLLPGFEEALVGMKEGEEKAFLIPPEKGFGQPNPNNIQMMSKADFDNTPDLNEGLVISFADASGSELPGVVKSYNDTEVEIDFNHPLAGKMIDFRVKIISIKPAVKH